VCDCGYNFQKMAVDRSGVPRVSSRWERKYWPPIWNLETAASAALQGSVVAAFVTAATTAFSILSAFGVKPSGIDLPLSSLVDAAIFAAIAFGIYRMSRLAAVAGLSLYVVETIHTWAKYRNYVLKYPWIAVIPATFTLAFVNSVRGTFAYRKWRRSGIAAEGIGPNKTRTTSEPLMVTKPINWKNWLSLVVFGLFFAGSISGGKPFVPLVSYEALGYDAAALTMWGLFFWSLRPFVVAAISKVRS
jgi:hypothetical protein